MVAASLLACAFVLLGLGNTLGYHRLFTHRAFKARAPLRWALALLGALHSGPPILWVGLHRLHHLRSDDTEDPHSPRTRGFWHAHSGWVAGVGGPATAALFALSGFGQQARTLVYDLGRVAGKPSFDYLPLVPDLTSDGVLAVLDRPLVTPALFAVQLAIAASFGWPGIAWLWALHVLLTNASWAVNSVCHTPGFGRAPYDTGDDARDVPWLAPLTLGEAWHNTHHRFPRSARHGLDGGFDPTWWVLRGLVAIGLASEPWLPRHARGS